MRSNFILISGKPNEQLTLVRQGMEAKLNEGNFELEITKLFFKTLEQTGQDHFNSTSLSRACFMFGMQPNTLRCW